MCFIERVKDQCIWQEQPDIRCLLTSGVCCTYEAGSESVTERVLHEDKTHSTGLTISDPNILVSNEPS